MPDIVKPPPFPKLRLVIRGGGGDITLTFTEWSLKKSPLGPDEMIPTVLNWEKRESDSVVLSEYKTVLLGPMRLAKSEMLVALVRVISNTPV